MGRKLKELRIGETDYRLTQLGAARGAELWLDILRAVASPFEALARTGLSAAAGDAAEEAAGLAVVTSLVKSLDHATVNKLYAAFGPATAIRVPGAPGESDRWPALDGAVFDDHFAGNYLEMTQWLVASVLFNFAPFAEGGSLGTVLASLAAKVQAATPTPSMT